MSLERFSNKDSILSNNGLQRGIIWNNDILPSLMLDSRTITVKDNLSVEVHVYSQNGEYLVGGDTRAYKLNKDKIQIDYAAALAQLNIPRGYFEVATNIYSNLIGNSQSPVLQVKEISPDRREALIQLFFTDESVEYVYDGAIDKYFGEYASAFDGDIALNFGLNRVYKIINQREWTTPNSMVVRLYTPLPDDIIVNDTLWLVEELADTYIDNIQINSARIDNQQNTLRGPNFDIESNYNTITETEFKNWTQLLNTNLASSQQIINSYFSGSLESLNIGIDYTAFDNFVFYGSAYERLANFKYKLDLLEYYDSQLDLLDNATGTDTTFANNITKYNNQKQTLLGTFDNFERWLYYEPTASLTTHGTSGSYIGADTYALTPWPKYLSGSAYYVHTTDSALGQAWYNGFLSTASFYDVENANALIKTIPEHIRNDANNSEYELFVNMIGQHFDILYTYINALTKIYRPEEQPKLGIDKEALYEIAQSMGWKLANGRQASSLWQYKLGVDGNGKYMSTGSLFSKSDDEITTEIWRRIVNNLPYLLKTKGTARSVKALMNVYGIPQTLLSIREYGGPNPNADTPALIEDRFGYKLYISSSYTANTVSGSIIYYPVTYYTASGNWNSGITDSTNGRAAAITREIRFQPAVKNSMPILSVRGTTLTTSILSGITIEYTGSYSGSSDYGRIWISHYSSSGVTAPYAISASTEWLPLYDGDMWNLRWWWTGGGTTYNSSTPATSDTTYYVQVQKASDYINGKIIHQSSASVTPNSTYTTQWLYWSTNNLSPTQSPRALHIGGNANMTGYTRFPFKVSSSNMYVQEYREWLEELDQNTFDIHTLNPTSYVSSLNATASYNTLVRHYAFGSDLNAVDHSTSLIITSSHPASHIITNFSVDTTTNTGLTIGGNSYAFAAYSGSLVSTFNTSEDIERGQYLPIEETYYIDGISLGGQLSRSEKIRLEDNFLIRRLSPTNTAERSSFDYAPIDTNRLGLFYSQADQVNKDIFDQIGDIALDDYVGNPEDEFDYQYPQLRGFSTEYWKKYTNRNDINAFIRVFSQFDFTLFNQIKQLLPARVDEVMGLLVEPHALERNKIALTKRIGVENPQYTVVLLYQPTASSEYFPEYTASISTSYIVSADSVYHSSSNGYTDTGNTYANIVLRDHVVPMSYLTEEVPVDNSVVLNLTTYATTVNYRTNIGLAREIGVTGSIWNGITVSSPRLIGLYTGGGTDLLRTNVPTGSASSRLEITYPVYSQYDIDYDFTIKSMPIDANSPGSAQERCSLLLIDTNGIVTTISEQNQFFTTTGGAGAYKTYSFNNIRIPAYTNTFAVGIQYKETSGTDGLNMYADFMQVTASINNVYHSAIRPDIIEQTITPGYFRKVFHYSGSIDDTKIIKNAYHATSQSLGLYYSSSFEPINFQNDEVLQYVNPRYEGCRLSAPGININSNIAALGNSPIIEVYETNANQLIFTNTPANRSTGNNREPGNLTVR
jgi:hypothetical protein